MGSTKQEFARHRNWTKARILGFSFDPSYFTEEEKEVMYKIHNLRNSLITNWDKNSMKLGLTPNIKKPHR